MYKFQRKYAAYFLRYESLKFEGQVASTEINYFKYSLRLNER